MIYFIAGATGYLLGSLPTGLFIVWQTNRKNILDVGSGRMGATNAVRASGWRAGILTLIGDLIKGAVAILLISSIANDRIAEAVAGVAAVLGHNASIYLRLRFGRFQGGAGATTFAGGAIVFWPPLALILVFLTPLMLYITTYSSITSTALVALTIGLFAVRTLQAPGQWPAVAYALAAGLLVIYALRPNYRRLREGTERQVQLRDVVNRAVAAFLVRLTISRRSNRR